MRISDAPPPFDTQQAVEHLQAGGLSSVQAVAITRTLVGATANLCTKADLTAAQSALQAGIDDLKESDGRITDSIIELRKAINEVRVAVAQSQTSTVRMMLFTSFGIIGAVVALLRWVLPQ